MAEQKRPKPERPKPPKPKRPKPPKPPKPERPKPTDNSSPVVSFETWQREFYKYGTDGKLRIDSNYGGFSEGEEPDVYEYYLGDGVPGRHEDDLYSTGFDEVVFVHGSDVIATKRGLERGLVPKKDGQLRGLDYDDSKLDERQFVALLASEKKSFDGAFIQAGGTISERLITPSTQPRLGYYPVEYNPGLAPSKFNVSLGFPTDEGTIDIVATTKDRPKEDRKGFFRWK